MPSRYLLETSSVDGYLLEDGSGVLLLNSPPTITSQPSSTSVSAGATANFTVVADEAISYQWQQLVESINYVRFSSLSSMAETGNSTTGWIYTGTASDGTAGTPDWNLPLGVAASFSTQTTLGGSTPITGLYTSTSGAWNSGFLIVAYPAGGNWVVEDPALNSLVTTPRTYEAGDYVRIGYSDTGNTYLIEIARTGTPNTLLTTTGWYDLTTTDTLIYKQFADTAPYTGQFIQINAKTAGSGTQLVLTTAWTDPGGGSASSVISGGTDTASPATSISGTAPTTLVTYFPPSSTYLTNSWGTPTIACAIT